MSALAPGEITALARILGELDYYQLLQLRPDATLRDIKAAFYACSRTFHPDAHRHLDAELRAAVEKISRRIREAYSVLRDPRHRPAYDRHRTGGGGVRMQLAEAEADAARQRQAAEGRTPQGRQYFQLASSDLERQDLESALRHLRTALTFEPDNAGFRDLLASLKARRR